MDARGSEFGFLKERCNKGSLLHSSIAVGALLEKMLPVLDGRKLDAMEKIGPIIMPDPARRAMVPRTAKRAL